MVLKVSKRGVRSGNTLKASNSRFLRQYRLRSSIRRKLVGNEIEVFDTLTDSLPETITRDEKIEFSLNKKGRWALPNELRHNILHGRFENEDYGVQLVEEHRLLKKANCIRFTSNYGSIRQSSKNNSCKRPRRGRKHRGYFQISSILNANKGKKRRKSKHNRLAGGKSEPSAAAHLSEDSNEAFRCSSQQYRFPELRYEIVYPSPVTSSITHNPKYIDPSYGENNKNKRRAKLRKTRTKLADIIQEDFENSEANYEIDFDDLDEEEFVLYQEPPLYSTEAYFQEILFHTKKAQMLVMCSGKQRTQKESNEVNKEELPNAREYVYEADIDISTAKFPIQKFARGLRYTTTLEPVPVIIPSDDVDEWLLKQKFGKRLLECECFPRKFIIDLSAEVSNLDNMKFSGKSKADLTIAFLIFVHDADNEINNEKEEVYQVYLNMPFSVKINHVKIETLFDYGIAKVDDIIEKALFFVETLPYEVFKKQKAKPLPVKSSSASNLEDCASWNTQSYRLDNKVLHKMCFHSKPHISGEQNGLQQVSKMDAFTAEPVDVSSPTGKFCSICFEPIGAAVSATALMSCCHWFCDVCWKEHLLTGIGEGKIRLLCPEYDCTKEVDIATLLSLADINHVLKYLGRCHDTEVEQQSKTKWCPNPNCGAILRVTSAEVKTVSCQCGKKLCFDCLSETHWPAPCGAVVAYRRQIAGSGDDGIMPGKNIATVIVSGKNCPSCDRFVQKNGGCPCVSCPCGKSFCWGCGKPWNAAVHGEYCYKHGYSDTHNTYSRSIQPADHLISTIRISSRAEWYKTALEHRIKQHHAPLRNLKAPMKNLSFHLRRYVHVAEKRNESVTFDFELSGVRYSCEAEKTSDFLQNVLDLYIEIHRILEHIPIYLESVYPDKEVPVVERITSRMNVLSMTICDLLQFGANDNPKDVLDKLKEIRSHARNCITGLLKFINPETSARTC